MEQKINYQKKMEAYLDAHPARERLALHSCCGPCSTSVLEVLQKHFDVTLFFYNPNIHPQAEYDRRLAEELRLCEALGVEAVVCRYDPERFFEAARGLENEKEGGARCLECFRLRLFHTAELAASRGIDLLTSTLTVSPHKNARAVNEVGEEAAARYGIRWLPSDFKKKNGFLRSLELSKQYGLYRQDYCGCVFSMPKHDDKQNEEESK